MAQQVAAFTGYFQVWAYTVGHGCLLLRSTKSAARQTQIDVLFKDVAAICIPARFEGCAISGADLSDLPLQVDMEMIGDRRAYRVSGVATEGYVIAGAVAWDESDSEYHAQSRLLEGYG